MACSNPEMKRRGRQRQRKVQKEIKAARLAKQQRAAIQPRGLSASFEPGLPSAELISRALVFEAALS